MILQEKWLSLWLLVSLLLTAQYLPAQNELPLLYYDPALGAGYDRDTAYLAPLIRKSELLQGTNIDSSIMLTRKAVAYSRMRSFTQGAALGLLRLAFLTGVYKRDVALTEDYLTQTLAFLQQLPKERKGPPMVNYYRIKAYSFVLKGQVDSSAYYYNQALSEIDIYDLRKTELPYSVYIELSNVYNNNNQSEKALFYLKKAEPFITDEIDLIPLYENMATTYEVLGKHGEAEQYALKGLELLRKNTPSVYEITKSTLYFRLGQAKAGQKKIDEAITLHKTALAEDAKIPLASRAMEEYQSLANIYYQAGDYRNAESSLNKAIQSAQQQQLGQSLLASSYTLLYRLYSGPIKNYRLAYYYRDLAANIKDSAQQVEKQEMINNLEIRYRTLEKDKELNQKQLLLVRQYKEITQKQLLLVRQKFWITSITLMALLLTLLLVMVYRNSRNKQRLHLKNMNALQREKEISNLKSVIAGEEKERVRLARDLHDGVSVLFSAIKMKIGRLPREHESLEGNAGFNDLTLQMDYAIKELRRTAHNLMPDMLLEGGLSEAIYYFCQSLQQNTALEITFQQYGTLPPLQKELELSLYRIVQELVQNILKHAAATKALVQLNYRNDVLSITVEDNGRGFDPMSADNQKGMGLKSIRTRLDILKGSMDIRSGVNGTAIYLEFEIHPALKPQQ